VSSRKGQKFKNLEIGEMNRVLTDKFAENWGCFTKPRQGAQSVAHGFIRGAITENNPQPRQGAQDFSFYS
jgi:hypothetical protein